MKRNSGLRKEIFEKRGKNALQIRKRSVLDLIVKIQYVRGFFSSVANLEYSIYPTKHTDPFSLTNAYLLTITVGRDAGFSVRRSLLL